CVSRDVARISSESITVEDYVARSSWISAAGPPVAIPSTQSKLASDFQRRQVISDYQSNAIARASASNSDLILFDLVDERFGVYPARAGGYITYLNEVQ